MCLVKQQVPVPSYYSAIIYLKWLGYFPVPIHASLFLNLSFHLESLRHQTEDCNGDHIDEGRGGYSPATQSDIKVGASTKSPGRLVAGWPQFLGLPGDGGCCIPIAMDVLPRE